MPGLAEAFAYVIWDKQHFPDIQFDICWFQNHVNDILSFYKEELAGEMGNYTGGRARATGKTVQDVIGETIVLADRVRRTLGDGPVRDAW
ncbi:hypothetical protein DAEQUDRAFT_764395 [Daedalea quercina L-15889]|uniref:Uncharacterized protein n=1 Tax=Daedalea quercina L-15889 TaxID=1314783 RepID=A0A165RJE6_9APHY|nr:hypothetical protein DAEQUDRAFT_764395 [Daedalea quercina L-15889]